MVVGSGVLVVVEHVGEALQGGLGQVAAFAVLPLLVLFEQDGSDQAGDGLPVGEDLDNVGAALDLAAQALDGVVGPDLLPVLPGEGRKRGQVGLGVGEHVGDLGEGVLQGVDDVLVLGGDGLLAGLGEDRGDQGARRLGAGRAEPSLEVMLRAKWTRHRCQAAPGRIALTAAWMPAWASLVTSTTPSGS